MPLKILSLFLLVVPAVHSANPQIAPNGVVNSASYLTAAFPNYGLARGSLFLVFGTALGPQTLVSATFPLPASDGLAGTRVLLSNGGFSAACPMVYTSLTQVAAIVPSNAPEGDGTLVVSYQNLASASVPVHVVRSAFGIFTLNQAGSGPAVLQNFVSPTSTPVNTLLASAHPGQTVILWGTGLGPATGDETAGPLPAALPFLDNVYVGGQPASVRYAGRSGCCAGVDQIVFDVPAGVTGCYVPVGVQTGGVIGNFGTISVSAAGNECDDPLSFRASDLATLERNGILRTGQATLSRNLFFGDSMGELNLTATFLSYDAQTLTAALAPLNPSVGGCYLSATTANTDLSGLPHGTGLDAGAAITANGPTGFLTATGTAAGNYAMLGSLGNLPAGSYQFAGTGGARIGAFQSTLNVGSGLQWTNAASFMSGTVSTGQPLTVAWIGGDPNGYVGLRIASANHLYNASVQCNAPAAASSFTVPAYLMATVFPSASSISLTSVSARSPISAGGLDVGGITATDTTLASRVLSAMPSLGLVALYDFIPGASSTVLYDRSGSGNNGTLGAGAASPVWTAQGLSFSGAQVVNLLLPPLSPLTIITALAPTSFAGTQVFIGSGATNTYDGIVGGHWSSRSSYGSVGVSLDSGNSASPVIFTSVRGPETFGSWGNGAFNLSTAQTVFPDANTLPTIGSTSFPFSGLVYYQAVYNRALNDDELFQAYQFIRAALALRGLVFPARKSPGAATFTAFGDSITQGIGASVPAKSYAALIGTAEGAVIANAGLSGSQITTQVDTIYGASPAVAPDAQYFILTGYNDMRAYGTDTAKQVTFSDTLRAGLAWLAIPEASRIRGSSASVTYTGTWATAGYGVGKSSSTAGATAQFSVTGSIIYVAYTKLAGTAGSFSVTVDGAAAGTVNANAGVTDGNGRTYSAGLFRLGGLAYTAHTVKLTQISGVVYFDWAAGLLVSGAQRNPTVYVGNCLRMPAAGYASGGAAFANGSDAAVAQINVLIANIMRQMTADGLTLKLVDASSAYNPVTDVGVDNIHPNDQGHAKIANAFLLAMP